MTRPDTDDDCCRVCDTFVTLNPDMEWPDGQPICWGCLWTERCQLAEQRAELVAALQHIADHDSATCDGITAADCVDTMKEIASAALAKAL
jgi:hypothetical protein